ncbi:LapA family protein [Gordonia sp. DT219]|uniref:LapA family protein n=1 Tax=Gordonia sp. DT219 TaxID=3416658 RepID=UPI003CE76C5F
MSTPDSPSEHPVAGSSTPARNPAPMDEGRGDPQRAAGDVKHTRTRAAFVGLVIGAVILILLLIFILLNLNSQQINLVFWTVNLPVGVSLLIAAVAGALVTALIGGARSLQLSRALKRTQKNR